MVYLLFGTNFNPRKFFYAIGQIYDCCKWPNITKIQPSGHTAGTLQLHCEFLVAKVYNYSQRDAPTATQRGEAFNCEDSY